MPDLAKLQAMTGTVRTRRNNRRPLDPARLRTAGAGKTGRSGTSHRYDLSASGMGGQRETCCCGCDRMTQLWAGHGSTTS